MGSFLSTKSSSSADGRVCYRLTLNDAETMEKLWKIIESDAPYYGSKFSTILFRNHPQYIKYFHQDGIPEFVQDARIKKKFSTVCGTVSRLFTNYSRKIHQRDHLLGYIAMIHKDMELSSQDFENFMMDLLEMLNQERPKDMTTECRNTIMLYFSGLLRRIEYLMNLQRDNDFYIMEKLIASQKRSCGCKSRCNPPSIYGRSLEYWIKKKEYWQHRLAVWSSQQRDSSKMSSFPIAEKVDNKTHRVATVKYNFGKRTHSLVAGNKPDMPKASSYQRNETSSSESTSNGDRAGNWPEKAKILKNRGISLYRKSKKDRRRYSRNSTLWKKSKPMESIPETLSRILINSATSPRRKSSAKDTQAFRDAVKAHKVTKFHYEADKTSSGNAIKRKTIIDTTRARKRRKDKKFNAAELKTAGSNNDDLMLQSMDLRSLITSQAGKFAEVLANRKTRQI